MTNENRNRLREFCVAIAAVVLAACLLPCGRAVAAGPADVLLAGIARTEITPAKPVMLDGYESRKDLSQGIHDPLSARVIAFQRNGQEARAGFHRDPRLLWRDRREHAKGDPRGLRLAAVGTLPGGDPYAQRPDRRARRREGPPEQRGVYEVAGRRSLVAAVREALAHAGPGADRRRERFFARGRQPSRVRQGR